MAQKKIQNIKLGKVEELEDVFKKSLKTNDEIENLATKLTKLKQDIAKAMNEAESLNQKHFKLKNEVGYSFDQLGMTPPPAVENMMNFSFSEQGAIGKLQNAVKDLIRVSG